MIGRRSLFVLAAAGTPGSALAFKMVPAGAEDVRAVHAACAGLRADDGAGCPAGICPVCGEAVAAGVRRHRAGE